MGNNISVHHHHQDHMSGGSNELENIKTAWRAFKGWDLGSKLSLGMVLTPQEVLYLTAQLKKLPPCFRPSKLHFWDNTSSSTNRHFDLRRRRTARRQERSENSSESAATTATSEEFPQSDSNSSDGDFVEFVALCRTSVREIEWHGFGEAPPLHHYESLLATTSHRLSSLESVRLYNLDLRGQEMGSTLRSLLLFPQSVVHTLYMARCRLDMDLLQEFAEGLSLMKRGTLHTFVIVHCQLTDAMLELILDSLPKQPLEVAADAEDQANDATDPSQVGDRPDDVASNASSSASSSSSGSGQHGGRLLDLCVHANNLTVRSISVLAHFLSRHELLRSVTLHANPHIDALLTQPRRHQQQQDQDAQQLQGEEEEEECPELDHFLQVIQTQNTSLRHFSWHNCCRQGRGKSSRCEPCWQIHQVFCRNRWLALSKKLSLAMEEGPSQLWPLLLSRFSLCQDEGEDDGDSDGEVGPVDMRLLGQSKQPPTAAAPATTALYSLIQSRPFELAAVRQNDLEHFIDMVTVRDEGTAPDDL